MAKIISDEAHVLKVGTRVTTNEEYAKWSPPKHRGAGGFNGKVLGHIGTIIRYESDVNDRGIHEWAVVREDDGAEWEMNEKLLKQA